MRKRLVLAVLACLFFSVAGTIPVEQGPSRNAWAAEPKGQAAVFETKGYILAAHPVQVPAGVSGRIIKLHFEEGTVVKAGDVLAELDSTTYRLDYEQARAKMEAARARYEEIVASPQLSKAQRAAAKVELSVAEVTMQKAKHFLDQTIVRAPISGTVLIKSAGEGNLVNPRLPHLKASLCEIADLSDLEVELTIQERDLSKISKGQRCRVRSEAYPDRVYQGSVSRLMPIADRAKGALPVRVKVKVPKGEEGQYFRPEMAVVVSLLAKDTQ